MRLTKTRKPGRLAAVASALAVGVLLAGCGASESNGNSDKEAGEVDRSAHLRISYPLTSSMDPREAPEAGGMTITTWPVYDRLLQITSDAEYAPMLATDWEYSADSKTLTLKLRDDVTFSDGAPFDAEAVKANLEFSQAAKGTLLQTRLADISEVVVVDDHTVEIHLAEATTTVLDALSSTLGGIMISPKALKGGDLATTPVGTGAYVIESFKPGQEAVYTRRTDEGGIWDEETGGPAKVTIKTFDPDAAASALKSGQVDAATWDRAPDAFQSEMAAETLQYDSVKDSRHMGGLNFNTTLPPFDDPLVRQAVNHAIDREAIVESFMPHTQPRVQPWPKGLPGFDESREDAYEYDPEKAKELLAEAGHPDGVDAGEMLVPNVAAMPQIGEVVQANLAEVGIDAKLRTMDVFSLLTQWSEGGANAELFYMSDGSIDTAVWLDRMFGNPFWVSGGPSQEMAGLIEVDVDNPGMPDDERDELVGKAVDHATEEALYAPIWQGLTGIIHTSKLQNVANSTALGGSAWTFRHAYLTK